MRNLKIKVVFLLVVIVSTAIASLTDTKDVVHGADGKFHNAEAGSFTGADAQNDAKNHDHFNND